MGQEPVVRVGPHQELAREVLEARIEGAPEPLVLLLDQPDHEALPLEARDGGAEHLRRRRVRAVVHEDQLEVAVCLRLDRAQEVLEIGLDVEAGDDQGDAALRILVSVKHA